MSYCVNCGVELDKTAEKCPLCGVEVVNPIEARDTISPPPYPKQDITLSKTDRRYAAQMLSIMLTFLGVMCIILNMVYLKGIIWFIYPVGAFALVLLFSVPPLLFKASSLEFIAIDGAAVLGYLYIIERFGGTYGWFHTIALPVVLSMFVAFVILYFYVCTMQPGKLLFTSVLFFLLGLISMCIDISTKIFLRKPQRMSWSLIVLACCLALSLALFATDRNMHIKRELKKRFHL